MPSLTDITRSMPWDEKAERGVLSCIFHDPNLISSEKLHEDYFYHPGNKLIYQQMVDYEASGKPVDYIGFSKWMMSLGLLDKAGGAGVLSEILNFVPTPAHFGYYCGILRDLNILRKVISVSTENIQGAYSHQEDIPAFLDTIEQNTLAIRPKDATEKREGIKHTIMQTFDALAERMASDKAMIGKPTGMVWIDKMTQGMKPETWFWGARPGEGKTSILLRFLISLAVYEEVPTGVFSLEMSTDALNLRLISILSGIPLDRLLSGKLETDDLPKYHKAVSLLKKAPIWIDDRPGLTLNQIKAKARRWHREYGVKGIMGDYLQRMGLDRKGKGSTNTADLHSSNVTGITDMGKELGMINIWLAQLNRQVTQRAKDSRPFMSDFEGTGRIEQDADLVGLLSTIKDQPPDFPNTRHVCIDIAKQRNGATGHRVHEFHGPTVSFSKYPLKIEAA